MKQAVGILGASIYVDPQGQIHDLVLEEIPLETKEQLAKKEQKNAHA